MQDILAVVSVLCKNINSSVYIVNCDVSLIREVDVVEEEGEVLEHPLGEVEVDGRALQKANVENGLPNAAPVFNLHMQLSLHKTRFEEEIRTGI